MRYKIQNSSLYIMSVFHSSVFIFYPAVETCWFFSRYRTKKGKYKNLKNKKINKRQRFYIIV